MDFFSQREYFRISRSNIFDHLPKSTFWEQNFRENLSCQYEHVIFVKYDSWVIYSSKYSSFINLLPFCVDTKIRFFSKSNFHKPFKIPYKVPSYKMPTNEKNSTFFFRNVSSYYLRIIWSWSIYLKANKFLISLFQYQSFMDYKDTLNITLDLLDKLRKMTSH